MRGSLVLALLILAAACALPAGAETAGTFDASAGWRTIVIRAPAAAPQIVARDPSWRASVVRLPVSMVQTGSLPNRQEANRRLPSLTGHEASGIASFYWQEQMTANGERFDPSQLTAAHLTLPFNTLVKVTHVASGRSVIVRINDRGPYKPGRIIDLSDAAAGVLGMRGQGLAMVKLEVVR